MRTLISIGSDIKGILTNRLLKNSRPALVSAYLEVVYLEGFIFNPSPIWALIGSQSTVWFVAHKVPDSLGVFFCLRSWHVQVLVFFLSEPAQ